MKLPLQRIDSYTQPVSGTVAFEMLTSVKAELLSQLPELATVPVFEVSSEPRGTYTGVTVFVEKENLDRVITLAEGIEAQLESLGYRVLIAVRTWTA